MRYVLLIEPDAILGITYKEALEQAGHQVICSRHAQDAVMQFDDKRPDIVVLELQMPGHGGIEFLYEFRSYPEWQNVPVVVHTMVPLQKLDTHSPRFDQLGVVDFLYKPATDLRKLVRTVGEILQPV